MKGPTYDFHYSHLLPKKPGVLPLDMEQQKNCVRCGAAFITRARGRKRCDACKPIVAAAQQRKANERLKARRKAAKA